MLVVSEIIDVRVQLDVAVAVVAKHDTDDVNFHEYFINIRSSAHKNPRTQIPARVTS